MYCKNCGNLIDDNAVICPKCGVPIQSQNKVAQQNKTNTLAIWGLVLSFLVPLAGLICSIIARKQCRETGEQGMGLATAGMVISIIAMALAAVYLIIYVVIIAAML